jgi:hypothetical protein
MPVTFPIRDRIKDFRRVPASSLVPHPDNWRTHPQAQRDALVGLLAEIGYAGAQLVRELPDGSLQMIDGHARAEEIGEQLVPVLVTDLNEDEAKKLLLTFDPLGAMAEADQAKLDALLAEVKTDDAALGQLLDGLRTDSYDPEAAVAIKPLDEKPPPKLTWVLIGIPTVRFGEIAADVERLAAIPGLTLESTFNDG